MTEEFAEQGSQVQSFKAPQKKGDSRKRVEAMDKL